MSDHVSDLAWDRLLAGELLPGAAQVALDHAGGCGGCGARLGALRAAHHAFGDRPVPIALRGRSRAGRLARALVPMLVAAAAFLVVRAWPAPDSPAERAKGRGPALLLAAGRPGALVPLAGHDAIHPGEYLQAGYSAARDGFGAVLSRDGGGTAMAYVPAHGDAMVALPAGVEASFPQSTLLDGVTGEERIVIVWCEAPRPLAPLVAELRAGSAITAPEGCTTRALVLDKQELP